MTRHSLPQLTSFDLHAMSDVQVRFSTGEIECEDYSRTILVIHFQGTYGIGSAGNDDALYMTVIGNAGIEAIRPDGVILDMSQLHYEWGDMLDSVLGIGDRSDSQSSAVVVGPDCREAIGTLCGGTTMDVCDQDDFFDDLADAWAYVRTRLTIAQRGTLLHAASHGEVAVAAARLAAGDDPNVRSLYGDTPLHLANHPEIVRLLLAAGADPNAKAANDVRPLHRATDLQCVELLLAAGADPDARSWNDESPLSNTRSAEIAQRLIAAGADVQQRRRSSLLHDGPSVELAEVYREAGVPLNAVNEEGRTPLDTALTSLESERAFEQHARRQGTKERIDRLSALVDWFRKHGGKTAGELGGEPTGD
ncbi:ankyrin repeat domain-containing protein [Blastopirellula marina]|uniref:Uncharacterized protein n=1 Tax=Blastopirellula marina TaxID=124 RepID=A0A2S8FSF2_9BACT|nr:ankyrin repeat domain-containing protein [Blastopirellula marina]PQO35112.1 hypothetical protein C5Y98_14265 [Blastopirellula marina]PTL43861.1 ankyrin repeat domain-containing protein [Blastopirellula marina]